MAAGEQPYGSTPHFWKNGPEPARALPAPRRVKTRNGRYQTCTHEVLWFLDRVEGDERHWALARLYDVLLDPDGWIRTGVHWKRVMRREEAGILVRVIPMATTVCGAGAAGCYSYGYERDFKPVAEMGVEAINAPGEWRVIVGMELCGHGTVKMEDMYTSDHVTGYVGSMGTWQAAEAVGYRPTRAEIEAATQWLAGTLDPGLIHHQ